MTTTQTTRVHRGWMIKRFIFPTIALVVLGVWGLLDATVIYPRNGRLDASLKLRDYMQAAEDARRLAPSFIKVDSPRDELSKLGSREDATAAKDVLSPLEKARLAWLRSLKMVWDLDKAEIWVADVKRPLVSKTGDQVYAGVGGVSDAKHEMVRMVYLPRSAEGKLIGADKSEQVIGLDAVSKNLKEYWTTAKTPSPLAFYDLPLQWVFTVVGFGGAAYLIVLYMRVASKRYQYEAETNTLIVPGGARIAPADIKELDKRKWHKFYVTMNLKDGTAQTFDLMRHDPLEEWILEMERVAFPEAAAEAKEAAEDAAAGSQDELRVPKDVGHVSAMTYGGVVDGVFGAFVFDSAAVRAAGAEPRAYAQGEVLKALSVAMRDDGGWRQWLTAATGTVKDSRVLGDVLSAREGTLKQAAAQIEEPLATAAKAGEAIAGEWYVMVVGRLSEHAAKRAHEILMDPPPSGFAGFAALRVHPPTIDRFVTLLGLEPGNEIKGDALVGTWAASREDLETAGLKAPVVMGGG